jgi:hypothetical protein
MTITMQNGKRAAEEPPYTRYAFLNPYNLSILAGAAVTSAATGEAWIALCATAAEAVWLLFAPESTILRRVWFDRMWADARRAEDEARLERKIQSINPAELGRVRELGAQRARIEDLARENPSFGTSLMKAELAKLDGLVEDFVDLAIVAARNERHLASFDLGAMQRAHLAYSAQLGELPERDPRRGVAMRNLEVIAQRGERYKDLGRALGTARGQMDLIENTFRLLADEIVTMASPGELGQRLDDLRIAVDAIRETVNEADVEIEEDFGEEAGLRRREGEWQ